MSADPVRLHPDDIAAIADEVIRRMHARPRAQRDERPTVTPEQQQHARAQLQRLGLAGVGSRR